MIHDDLPRAEDTHARWLGEEQLASAGGLFHEEEPEESHRPPEDPFIATHYWVVGGSE
jgi:hypothetical protein